MNSEKNKVPFTAVLALLLTGTFLALETGRLFLDAHWKIHGIGLFISLCAAEMIAGFSFVRSNNRKKPDFIYTCGALLLTLHAGVMYTTLDWIINFAMAGGIIALLVRTKKVNTFFPFAAAFALGLAAVLIFPAYALLFSFGCGMLLTGVLIIGSTGLRHLRWLFLILIFIQAALFPAGKNKIKILQNYRNIHDVVVSTLPASLLTDGEQNGVSVLQITQNKQLKEIAPWKIIPGISKITSCTFDEFTPIGIKLDSLEENFDIISVETLPDWPDSAKETLLLRLSKMVETQNGVMVFPRSVMQFMPQDKTFITLPGSEKRRLAAIPFSPESVTPEKMDKRLQKRLEYIDNKEFMIPGVFQALFNGNPEKVDFISREVIKKTHSFWFWITLGIAWLFFRITAARKGKNSLFLAAMDNTSSVVIVTLSGFCVFCANRMYSFFPESIFLLCIIFVIPFIGKKGILEKALVLCSIILPWLFTDPEHGVMVQLIIFSAVLISCISCGMTASKMMLEKGNTANRILFPSLIGICFGGILFHLFFDPENLIPVLAAASLLRAGNLFRE